jgi:hypothetical protein
MTFPAPGADGDIFVRALLCRLTEITVAANLIGAFSTAGGWSVIVNLRYRIFELLGFRKGRSWLSGRRNERICCRCGRVECADIGSIFSQDTGEADIETNRVECADIGSIFPPDTGRRGY